jgi:hypothetical protein
MTTAFWRGGGGCVAADEDGALLDASTALVTALKCAMSPASFQGRPPPRPMPQARPAATTSW